VPTTVWLRRSTTPFYYGVWCGVVVLDALVSTRCHELSRYELATIVRAQHSKLAVALLHSYLMASAAAALVLRRTAHM
jgi:hypothetical protein